MRKGLLLVGLLVMVLVMGMSLVRADDDAPKPGTPEDNECNPGGVLYREENQDGCPSVWYWKAGWFLARFNRGLIARADFPTEFASVLPLLPAPEDSVFETCWAYMSRVGGIQLIGSIQYTGPANTLGNVIGYFSSADCTGSGYVFSSSAVIFANNLTEAQAICSTLGSGLLVGWLKPQYPTAPDNAYGCE